jgi:hypothetical protein
LYVFMPCGTVSTCHDGLALTTACWGVKLNEHVMVVVFMTKQLPLLTCLAMNADLRHRV